MKAIITNGFGSTDGLQIVDIPIPVPGENEVLIQVKAISINPVDVKTRAGKGMAGRFKDVSPLILGWDVSGVIVKTGKDIKIDEMIKTGGKHVQTSKDVEVGQHPDSSEGNTPSFKEGDEVFGMVNFPGHGQAYAEYVVAPANHLALKPTNTSHEAAAAATLAALTAWQAFTTQANIQPGQKVLIQAAAGGVGHYAVQIAKHLGAYVVGTSSASNKEFVISLGADEHIDYHQQSLDASGNDYDFVLDPIGGDNIDRSIAVVKKGGTLISIPSGLSDTVKEKAAAQGVNGFFFLVSSNGSDMKELANLLQKGIIRSHVSQTFTFDNMPAAHLAVETGKTKGKVVVTL